MTFPSVFMSMCRRIHILVFLLHRLIFWDLSDVTNIDTSGIHALEELHQKLIARGTEVSLINNISILKHFLIKLI